MNDAIYNNSSNFFLFLGEKKRVYNKHTRTQVHTVHTIILM